MYILTDSAACWVAGWIRMPVSPRYVWSSILNPWSSSGNCMNCGLLINHGRKVYTLRLANQSNCSCGKLYIMQGEVGISIAEHPENDSYMALQKAMAPVVLCQYAHVHGRMGRMRLPGTT